MRSDFCEYDAQECDKQLEAWLAKCIYLLALLWKIQRTHARRNSESRPMHILPRNRKTLVVLMCGRYPAGFLEPAAGYGRPAGLRPQQRDTRLAREHRRVSRDSVHT